MKMTPRGTFEKFIYKKKFKHFIGPIRHPCTGLIAMSDFICVIPLLNAMHREPDTFTLNTLPWKGLQITEINVRHLGTAQQWHARFKSARCSSCFRLMKHAKAKKDNISFLPVRTLFARRYFCPKSKIKHRDYRWFTTYVRIRSLIKLSHISDHTSSSRLIVCKEDISLDLIVWTT